MALSDYLRPEYLFRPSQIWQRVQQKLHPQVGDFDQVTLPWGLPLRVRSFDFIGLHIRWFGVFDLCVSEVIWRLLDPGDTAIDVGANLGYITSLMAARTGKTGNVLAIEPHPELYQELLTNLHDWQQMGCTNGERGSYRHCHPENSSRSSLPAGLSIPRAEFGNTKPECTSQRS